MFPAGSGYTDSRYFLFRQLTFFMRFNHSHIANVLTKALKQGTSPRELALTCALGVIIGLFPIIGTTTTICFITALLLRLNVAIIQLVNYVTFPLQVLFLVPFINAGTYIFNVKPLPYDADQLIPLFKNNFWGLVAEIGLALISGVGVWALVSVPLFFMLFFSSLMLLKKFRRQTPQELPQDSV